MLKGPNCEKRPADAVGAAVMVAKIATGEIEEQPQKASKKKPPKKQPKGQTANDR